MYLLRWTKKVKNELLLIHVIVPPITVLDIFVEKHIKHHTIHPDECKGKHLILPHFEEKSEFLTFSEKSDLSPSMDSLLFFKFCYKISVTIPAARVFPPHLSINLPSSR